MDVLVFIGDGDMASCTPMMTGAGFVISYASVPTGGFYTSQVDLTNFPTPMIASDTSYEVILTEFIRWAPHLTSPRPARCSRCCGSHPETGSLSACRAKFSPVAGMRSDHFRRRQFSNGVMDPVIECYDYGYVVPALRS